MELCRPISHAGWILIFEHLAKEKISPETFIRTVSEGLSKYDYLALVDEFVAEKKCGYPLCGHPLDPSLWGKNQNVYISPKSNKVYDVSHRKDFCSDQCFSNSNFLCSQLEDGVKSNNIKLSVDDLSSSTTPEIIIEPQSLSDLEFSHSDPDYKEYTYAIGSPLYGDEEAEFSEDQVFDDSLAGPEDNGVNEDDEETDKEFAEPDIHTGVLDRTTDSERIRQSLEASMNKDKSMDDTMDITGENPQAQSNVATAMNGNEADKDADCSMDECSQQSVFSDNIENAHYRHCFPGKPKRNVSTPGTIIEKPEHGRSLSPVDIAVRSHNVSDLSMSSASNTITPASKTIETSASSSTASTNKSLSTSRHSGEHVSRPNGDEDLKQVFCLFSYWVCDNTRNFLSPVDSSLAASSKSDVLLQHTHVSRFDSWNALPQISYHSNCNNCQRRILWSHLYKSVARLTLDLGIEDMTSDFGDLIQTFRISSTTCVPFCSKPVVAMLFILLSLRDQALSESLSRQSNTLQVYLNAVGLSFNTALAFLKGIVLSHRGMDSVMEELE